MKQLKLILSSVAIIVAVTGAFALREQQQPSTTLPQFYFDGSQYHPAGHLGVDYLCQASPDTCTFIQHRGGYIPSHSGTRISVDQ